MPEFSWKRELPEDEYLVYTLSVPGVEEADIRAAMNEAAAQMCRLAAGNFSSFDAREVLKVFVPGWEAETFALSEDQQLDIWRERDELVRTWLRRALRLPEVQATLVTLAAQGVVPVFAAQVHATEFHPL